MLSITNPFTPYKIVRLNERTRSKNAEQTLADSFFAFLHLTKQVKINGRHVTGVQNS